MRTVIAAIEAGMRALAAEPTATASLQLRRSRLLQELYLFEPIRILTLFAALAALAVALTACGGGGGSEDPQKVIEDATLKGVESGDVDLSLGVESRARRRQRRRRPLRSVPERKRSGCPNST